MNRSDVFAGFLLALALTLVGLFLGFFQIGLFAGTAAGSYLAARRAGHHGAAQGAGVSGLVLVSVVVPLVLRVPFEYHVSFNGTTLLWAAAVLLLGPVVGLATRR